jgi:hypothetical protein
VSSTSPAAMAAALPQVDMALVKAFTDRGVDEALAVALALGEVIIDRNVDDAGVPLTRVARSIAVDTINWLGNAPLDLSRVETRHVSNVKATKELELEAAGIFEAYADGTRMRVTTRSIARRRIALAILSHPVDGPRPKIRQPSGRFQKTIRPRTAAELAGLARGNAKRAEEARRRREAKAAIRA